MPPRDRPLLDPDDDGFYDDMEPQDWAMAGVGSIIVVALVVGLVDLVGMVWSSVAWLLSLI